MTKLARKIGLPALFLGGAVFGSALTGTALAVQSHMFAARADLNAALGQLNAAIPDKAGHRVNAINLTNQAINEVNKGIDAGRR